MKTYKLTPYPNLINRVEDDDKTTTFKQGTTGWQEYEAWVAAGNTVEPYRTTEEQATFDAIAHKAPRRDAYEAAGLTFDYWNEINIEGNTEAITQYKADRDAIKASIPKIT